MSQSQKRSNPYSDYDDDRQRRETKRANKKSHTTDMVRYLDKYENSIFIAGDREIHFNAHVDGETMSRIKKLIAQIVDDNKDKLVKFEKDGSVPSNRAKDPPVNITYIVNSPGGSVHDVLDFVDYVNLLRCTFSNIKFTSVITGLVASAGTVMAIISDKKKMTRFAFSMIHELSSGLARTNFTRIRSHGEFIQNVHDVLVTIYQEYRKPNFGTHQTTEELEKLLLNETWMNPQQYKDLGFIDEIISHYIPLVCN
jgi:ATP-dependent protease ClpP protease subunit